MRQRDAYWYVAKIKSGETDKALRSLISASIHHLYPTGKLLNGTEYPLVPGYVFVLLPCDDAAWAQVSEARGIDHLLPMGAEVPACVPSKQMDEFYKHIVQGEYIERLDDEPLLPWFNRGESVMITSGPFVGHTGVFKRVHKGAVVLNVPFFGTELEAVFNGHQVAKIT